MNKANARYYVHNEVTEPVSLDSVAALAEHFRMHGIPLDAQISFSGTPGRITRVLRVDKTHDGVYVTVGSRE
jgi:hypothetical protein